MSDKKNRGENATISVLQESSEDSGQNKFSSHFIYTRNAIKTMGHL